MARPTPTVAGETGPAQQPLARRGDLVALFVVLVLIAVAVVVGFILRAQGVPIHARIAPLFGDAQQQAGPASLVVVTLAVLVVRFGPTVAERLRWPILLLIAWATSLTWVLSLALVVGWERLAGKLERTGEYASEVPTAPPLLELLQTFADHIVAGQPDSWTTHVAGHPPGALIFFILLDRIGLGGGAAAAIVVAVVGASACVAVAIAAHSLDSEQLARRAMPFLVLTPAAIWIGISADGVFLAVSAWGVALLAVATRQRAGPRMILSAVGAGLLLGASLYLSYGLILIGAVALAVLVVTRQLLPVLVAGGSVLLVVAAVTIAGFSWWEGLDQLVIRYNQGWGASRPYAYWVWANLAALALCTGPAVAPALRRGGAALRAKAEARTVALVLGAAIAVLAATLTGLSKAEVERIWLPFALWLVVACAFLPRRDHRWWLAVQGLTALIVVHLTLPGF